MSEFKLHILGCGSAKPSRLHQPSCQVVERRGRLMLVDCGEGAQMSVCRQHLRMSRISDIFISHLHGDHLLGLPGLLSTMSLHDKGGVVTVHIMREGAEMLRHVLATVAHETSFEIQYDIVSPEGGTVYEDKSMTVTAFPLNHGVPCVGYRFDEKPKARHLRGDMIRFHDIPLSRLEAIRAGEDFVTADGRVIPNAVLTTDADPCMSYAYCSDTAFDPRVVEYVRGVTTLYHEATYTSELAEEARRRGHSTPAEAARIAEMAGAGRLILGHYSTRYESVDAHLAEARAIFPNTIAANEGMTIDLERI